MLLCWSYHLETQLSSQPSKDELKATITFNSAHWCMFKSLDNVLMEINRLQALGLTFTALKIGVRWKDCKCHILYAHPFLWGIVSYSASMVLFPLLIN